MKTDHCFDEMPENIANEFTEAFGDVNINLDTIQNNKWDTTLTTLTVPTEPKGEYIPLDIPIPPIKDIGYTRRAINELLIPINALIS